MIKFFQKLKAKKGFTLVELIVVIAIIGVLAAILIPTMLGYVTSSRVTSANSTAASIKNNVDTFLTACDTAGYGMKLSASAIAELGMSINANGEWEITLGGTGTAFSEGAAANTGVDAFKSKDGVGEWEASGKAEDGKTKVDAAGNATAMLAYELKNLFPDVESAAVIVYLEGGKAKYCAYTADTDDFGDIKSMKLDDFKAGTSKWDNNTAGVSADGYIIGTAPALSLNTGATT